MAERGIERKANRLGIIIWNGKKVAKLDSNVGLRAVLHRVLARLTDLFSIRRLAHLVKLSFALDLMNFVILMM